jgi:hypothetical protein
MRVLSALLLVWQGKARGDLCVRIKNSASVRLPMFHAAVITGLGIHIRDLLNRRQ